MLTESQLSWARLNIPGFRDCERRSRQAIRETESSRARYVVERLVEAEDGPRDRGER